MKIEVEDINNQEDEILSDNDFFSEFETEKESFSYKMPKTEPELETEPEPNNLFEDIDEDKILTFADKKKIALQGVEMFTNTAGWLISTYTGNDEKNRYLPDNSYKKSLTEAFAKIIPDKWKMPVWLEIVIILVFAYMPILSLAKKDIQLNSENNGNNNEEETNSKHNKESKGDVKHGNEEKETIQE